MVDGKEVGLQETTAERDIGVVFDPNLNFRPHMEEQCKKANKIMGIIRRTYSYMTGKEFCLLYKALVRPHLEGNNVIWAPRYKKDAEMIEKVQRRATKLVPGLKDMQYPERLKQLKLPNLNLNTATGIGGHSQKIRRDHASRDVRRSYLMQRAAAMWNNLPEDVVMSKTLNTYKNRLDIYWKHHPLMWDYAEAPEYNTRWKQKPEEID